MEWEIKKKNLKIVNTIKENKNTISGNKARIESIQDTTKRDTEET